jgi:hypothetical protein
VDGPHHHSHPYPYTHLEALQTSNDKDDVPLFEVEPLNNFREGNYWKTEMNHIRI